MAVNPNFNSQGASTPVPGGFAQPAAGVTEQIETPADPAGNAYATSLAANGVANLQTANFRDSAITVQVTGSQSAPTAGTVVATCTPGTAGLWEITVQNFLTGSGTPAVADLNNMGLYQTSTSRLVLPQTEAINFPYESIVVLNLSGADTVNVKAIGAATASVVYVASIVCRRVG